MAIHAPITGAPFRASNLQSNVRAEQQCILASRAAIEAEIQRLIDLLDIVDGDPDLEPEDDHCLAADDGCGVVLLDGVPFWGSHEEQGGRAVPRYGLDQTQPIRWW